MNSLLRSLLTWSAPAIFLVSCASPSVVRLKNPQSASALAASFLNPQKLTADTRNCLDDENLYATFREDPDAAIAALRELLAADPSHRCRLAFVEVCTDTGDQFVTKDPLKAAGYHLAAAAIAFAGIIRPTSDSSQRQNLTTAYNHSSGQVAQALTKGSHATGEEITVSGPGKNYRVRFRKSGDGFADPGFFDTFAPADYLKFQNVDLERNRRGGIGGAMVGHRNYTPERHEKNPFLSMVGMSLPINATLDFSAGDGDVELAFHDLLLKDESQLAGRKMELAADLTAALAMVYDYAPKHTFAWKGLKHPEEYKEEMGLFQLEPFRRNKIPLILVHGLLSSPRTWFTAINTLQADPNIRERYQILVFYYPTGFPIGYNSAALRSSLKKFQETFDPERSNPRMREMIVIGHSMGGLLTNAQIRNSSYENLKMFLTKPINEIDGLSDEQKSALNKLLIYRANPDVTRAVFLDAPHRGSDIAKNPLGRFGSSLIRFPFKMITEQPLPPSIDGFTDLARDVITSRPNGINDLRPRAPDLMAVLEQPVGTGIAIHSIVARHELDGPLEESTDTVVPYWSSHLDRVASEKVIHATHTTTTGHSVAIEELRRILYLHAGLRYQQKN